MKTLIRLVGAAAALVAVLVTLLFRRRRRIYTRLLDVPPPRFRVRVDRGLRLTMRDGVRLAADHYYPRAPGRYPTILIRTPYGRTELHGVFGVLLAFVGQRFAEQGYHVIVQDVRGRFDSGGEFTPYFLERGDGLDTLAWISTQAWFNGQVGTWGPSYLGIVQWAIADAPQVKAMLPVVTSARLHNIVFPDGAFDLGLALRWMGLFQMLDRRWNTLAPGPLRSRIGLVLRSEYRLALRDILDRADTQSLLAAVPLLQDVEHTIHAGFDTLPLTEADALVTGEPVQFYRDWIAHPRPDDPMWQEVEQAVDMRAVTAPVHLVGGWYDFFLRGLLDDYAELRAAGHVPHLTIGPWQHFSNGMVMLDGLREGLAWFDAHLKGDNSRLRRWPVRIFVMGAREWRDLPDWPPPSREQRLFLRAGRSLTIEKPLRGEVPDTYRYDPADPTPIIGGAQFNPAAGPFNNRRLEARRDVLAYTSQPLARDLEVIGPVRLQLSARSSLDYTDFMGRLCDVHPDGRSINICDGLLRITPDRAPRHDDGSICVSIDMWATAHRFKAGHRIRLLVASGAHPRWNRNNGTGESDAICTTMRAADQTILHDAEHPSALLLPVTDGWL